MLRPRLLTLLCYGAMMSSAIGVNLLPSFSDQFESDVRRPGRLESGTAGQAWCDQSYRYSARESSSRVRGQTAGARKGLRSEGTGSWS